MVLVTENAVGLFAGISPLSIRRSNVDLRLASLMDPNSLAIVTTITALVVLTGALQHDVVEVLHGDAGVNPTLLGHQQFDTALVHALCLEAGDSTVFIGRNR